ncbi:hypothetical protein HY546_01060 [archaeon]|nr:hypothetical protein [archaeon]
MRTKLALMRYSIVALAAMGVALMLAPAAPKLVAYLTCRYFTAGEGPEVLIDSMAHGALYNTPQHVEHNFNVPLERLEHLPAAQADVDILPSAYPTGVAITLCGREYIYDALKWGGNYHAFVQKMTAKRHPLCVATTTAWELYKVKDPQAVRGILEAPPSPQDYVLGCLNLYPLPQYITDNPQYVLASYCEWIRRDVVVPATWEDFLPFIEALKINAQMNTPTPPVEAPTPQEIRARNKNIFDAVLHRYHKRAVKLFAFGGMLFVLTLVFMFLTMRSLYAEARTERKRTIARLVFTSHAWFCLCDAEALKATREKRAEQRRAGETREKRCITLLARARALHELEAQLVQRRAETLLQLGIADNPAHRDTQLDELEAAITRAEIEQDLRTRARNAAAPEVFNVVGVVSLCIARQDLAGAEAAILRAGIHTGLLAQSRVLQTEIRELLTALQIATTNGRPFELHTTVHALLASDDAQNSEEQAQTLIRRAQDMRNELRVLADIAARIAALPVRIKGTLPDALGALKAALNPTAATPGIVKQLKHGNHTLLKGRPAETGHIGLRGLEDTEARFAKARTT